MFTYLPTPEYAYKFYILLKLTANKGLHKFSSHQRNSIWYMVTFLKNGIKIFSYRMKFEMGIQFLCTSISSFPHDRPIFTGSR